VITVTGIRLRDIRAFEGEHFIPFDARLTVLMGRNNAGKSTVLRAPFLFLNGGAAEGPPAAEYFRHDATVCDVAVRFRLPLDELDAGISLPPQCLADITIQLEGVSRPLNNLPEFSSLQSAPEVEFGQRWTPIPSAEKGAGRTLRIVGGQGSYVDVTGGAAEVFLQSSQQRSNVNNDWFVTALTRSGAGNSALTAATFAHWEHAAATERGWIGRPNRRLMDTTEKTLQDTLIYLRMKHPAAFEHVRAALARAFPEFARLDFIDRTGKDAEYRPAFVLGKTKELARESIGSGAWTYLCILTAARTAKVTGARVLLLDEPHLYLHPGLERQLIDELLEDARWDGSPLQVVAATHSPTFVNAAVEHGTLNLLDWDDDRRTKVVVHTVRAGDGGGNVFDAIASPPSDLLYADRIVFVEGPSDVAALHLLARRRCDVGTRIRFVPLREADAIKSEVARYFSVIVQSHGTGFQARGLLILDADKKQGLVAAWDKLDSSRDPRKAAGLTVIWAGDPGNDIESIFCDEDFLVAYFAGHGVPDATSRPAIKIALAAIAPTATQKREKGCVAIATLHEQLVQGGGQTKADDLEALVRFYVGGIDEAFATTVRQRLEKIEDALRTMA
jgi:predicted ATPase